MLALLLTVIVAPQPPALARSLGGQVMENGAPVAAAEIQLTLLGGENGEARTLNSRTDERGAFRFDGIRFSRYAVVAFSRTSVGRFRGFAPTLGDLLDLLVELEPGTRLEIAVRGEDDQPIAAQVTLPNEIGHSLLPSATGTSSKPLVVVVAPGPTWAAASAPGYVRRAVEMAGRPGEVIPMKIVLDRAANAHGRVLDARGRPVSAVELVLLSPTGYGPHSESDQDGRFSFDGVAAGEYQIAVHSRGQVEPLLARLPSEDLVVRLPAGHTVSGRVFDPAGQPMASGEVVLCAASGNRNLNMRGIIDTAGTFEVRDVAPGPYRIEATHDTYPTARGSFVVTSSAPVEVTLRHELGETLSGRVVDDGGRPLEGLRIEAYPGFSASDCDPYVPAAQWTGPDGQFQFRHIFAGRYHLTVETGGRRLRAPLVEASTGSTVELVAERYRVVRGRARTPRGRPVADFRVNRELVRDSAGRFEITLPRQGGLLEIYADDFEPLQRKVPAGTSDVNLGDLPLVPGRVIRVAVVDENGDPIPGARARAELNDPRLRTRKADQERPGRFELRGLPRRGNVLVRVSARGYVGRSVTVPPGDQPVRIVLHQGAVIRGALLDQDGSPGAGVFVEVSKIRGTRGTVRRAGRTHSATADSSGRFEVSGLEPGRYWVRVPESSVRGGGAFQDVTVELTRRTVREVMLRERTGVDVQVRVTDSWHEPIRNLDVLLVPGGINEANATDAIGFSARSNPRDDVSTVPAVPPGRYSLVVRRWHSDGIVVTQPVLIQPVQVPASGGPIVVEVKYPANPTVVPKHSAQDEMPSDD